MSDDHELPAYTDFFRIDNFVNEDDLEMQSAAKNFYGKTLHDAELLFRKNSLHYGEDLLWMGTKAFEFYVVAFRNYLISKASEGDYLVASVLDTTFRHRYEHSSLGSAAAVVLECLDYAITNFAKFDIDDELQSKNLQELIEEFVGNETDLQLLKERFLEYGGNPDDIRGILESLNEIPDEPGQEPKLMTVDRWKKLRDEIAAGL